MFVTRTTANITSVVPVEWSLQIGTSSNEDTRVPTATDGSGNVYLTGSTPGNLWGNKGYTDVFLAKYNAAGTELWGRQFGSNQSDFVFAIAVDAAGYAYVAGQTNGALVAGNYAGNIDIFVTKFDPSGNQLWARQIGTAGAERADSVAVDGLGNVYISGYTQGAIIGTNAGLTDAYVVKFDGAGNEQWRKQFGTEHPDFAFEVAADGVGHVYLSGGTDGALAGTSAGLRDVYLMKLDAATGSNLWTRQWGTPADETIFGIAFDSSKNVLLAGTGDGDILLIKYDSAGEEIWTQQFGSAGDEIAGSIATDALGNIFICGYTTGDLEGSNAGGQDAYIAKLNSSGSLVWIEQIGTTGQDGGGGPAFDGINSCYLSGATTGSLGGIHRGGRDAYLVKFDITDTTPPALQSIVDDASGGPIFTNDTITYMVTFSEAMNATTVGTDDFANGSTAMITIGSVTPTADPAVFEVAVTATHAGTLRLRVAAGANPEDLAGNPLDTGTAIPDDTAIMVHPVSNTTFSDWIGGFIVGELTEFDDDPDGDGKVNGLENFLGTDPSTAEFAGLQAREVVTGGSSTFVFTHPQNPEPAEDVSAFYQWSANLENYFGDDVSNGDTTVSFSAATNTPAAGVTTVTASVESTVAHDMIFVILGVTKHP